MITSEGRAKPRFGEEAIQGCGGSRVELSFNWNSQHLLVGIERSCEAVPLQKS